MFCPIVGLTEKLIRCQSLSPNDSGCQDILIAHLEAMGFYIEKMHIGNTHNFWATHGKGETLAFAGHTDVVPPGNINYWITPPFKPDIRNGKLFGRGAADMKGAIAAMIIATERFMTKYPNHKGRLAFLITSDEESSAKNGTVKVVENLMSRNERIDYCLIGEPSSTKIIGDVVKNGRRGSITANLKIEGIQGHVAYPHLADNPIHRALPMLNELLLIKWDQGNDFFPPTNIQITSLKAGNESNNIIPKDFFIQFNFRFSNEITDKIIKDHVVQLLKRHKLKYKIKWNISGQPFFTLGGKLVEVVKDSIILYSNIQPQLLTTGGTSDGRFIKRMNAQIVELGLVNATIHKVNEYVIISDLQKLSNIYYNILKKMLF